MDDNSNITPLLDRMSTLPLALNGVRMVYSDDLGRLMAELAARGEKINRLEGLVVTQRNILDDTGAWQWPIDADGPPTLDGVRAWMGHVLDGRDPAVAMPRWWALVRMLLDEIGRLEKAAGSKPPLEPGTYVVSGKMGDKDHLLIRSWDGEVWSNRYGVPYAGVEYQIVQKLDLPGAKS